MITEQRVKKLTLESLKTIKDSEPTYQDLNLDDTTIVLGVGGPFDSIAFTAFATDLEEKLEDETGKVYVLNVEEIYRAHGKKNVAVKDLARWIAKEISQSSKRSASKK